MAQSCICISRCSKSAARCQGALAKAALYRNSSAYEIRPSH